MDGVFDITNIISFFRKLSQTDVSLTYRITQNSLYFKVVTVEKT